MITKRSSADRGHADHGWLKSAHSFSFADYQDPNHVHFGPLRVINDDQIAPGSGFGKHGHRDMEIVTYVTSGTLAHEDSMGNVATISPGEVQRMSAGTGVLHSEFNWEKTAPTTLLQIWIVPDRTGIAPGYEQKNFPPEEKRGRLRLLVSPDGELGSLKIYQNARMYAGLFDGAETGELALAPGRLAYLHVVRGSISANGIGLLGGDALMFSAEPKVSLSAGMDAEVLLFDLPMG